MTIYIYNDNFTMYHEEETCRTEIEEDFLKYELMDFLSDHQEEVSRAITCLVYGGSAQDKDVRELCDEYEQTLVDYIAVNMEILEVDEEDIDFYEEKYDWGD